MNPVSASVQNPVCPYCGTTNPVDAHVCRACGSGLENAPTVRASEPTPPEPPLDHLEPGTQLYDGRYLIVDVLGQGGFGITYRAMNAQRGGYVAIKEFYPQGSVSRDVQGNIVPQRAFVQDFERGKLAFSAEAQKLRNFRHPSIVKALAVFVERNTAYLVMEYLHGETLEQRIARGKLLSESEARTILLQLLSALEEVHNLGVLHRDIKPANIVLTDDRPELIDFGTAVKFAQGRTMKVSRRLLTPAYAPLEQCATSAKLGPWTDLYALGATFYEAVTGVQPPSALERANGTALKPIRDINPMIREPFVRTLEKCLEMRVDTRPQSCKAVRWWLNEDQTPILDRIVAEKSKPDYASISLSLAFFVAFPVFMVLAGLGLFSHR